MTTERVDAATERVDGDPELAPYRDLLIDYDWPNYREHIEWVANASTEELIDWAQTIRQQEGEQS